MTHHVPRGLSPGSNLGSEGRDGPQSTSRLGTPLTPVSRPERSCRLVSYQPWPAENSALCGHATVTFSGWRVARIPVFRRREGGLSVGTPSAPEIDPDGVQRRDTAGKRQYWPVIQFDNREARERWQKAVLAALSEGGVGG